MNCHASPNILDYLEDDGDDIDLIAYEEAKIDHVEERKRRINISVNNRSLIDSRSNTVGAILVILFGILTTSLISMALGEILIIGMGNSSTIDFLILPTQWLKQLTKFKNLSICFGKQDVIAMGVSQALYIFWCYVLCVYKREISLWMSYKRILFSVRKISCFFKKFMKW